MLVPSLGQVMDLARMTKCSSNLHAIGRASYIYSTENDGFMDGHAESRQMTPKDLPTRLLDPEMD